MRQSKAEVYLHLVWATKNRAATIVTEWERSLHRVIASQATQLGCDILAINGMPDHIHILVKVPTTVTIARLAQQMKGVSSRFVQEELSGGDLFAWQAGYAVFSVGRNQTRSVMEYIRGQKAHHAAQIQHDAWETTDQPYLPRDQPYLPRPQDDRREAS